MMLFIFVLPVMQVILFCLAIGRDPTGLRLAIANMEMNDTIVRITIILFCFIFIFKKIECLSNLPSVSIVKQHCPYKKDCSFENLSCRYLSHLNSTIIKEYYPDAESAIEAVRVGHAWGAIYFTENFTDALVARMALGKYTICF